MALDYLSRPITSRACAMALTASEDLVATKSHARGDPCRPHGPILLGPILLGCGYG
jgi:hypothetical protein